MVIPTKSGSCRCSKATAKGNEAGAASLPLPLPLCTALCSALCCLPFYSLPWYGSCFPCECVCFCILHLTCHCVYAKKRNQRTRTVPGLPLPAFPCLCVCVCVCLQLTYGFFSVFGFVNFTWNILLELSYIVACPNLPAWQRLHLSKFSHYLRVMDMLPASLSPVLLLPHSRHTCHSTYPLLHTHKQSRSQAVCKLTLSRLIEVLLTA